MPQGARKHIVITGGTSGIGLELVRKLEREHDLTVIGRPSERLKDLESNFRELNILEADLADANAAHTIVERLEETHKSVDILINNAAIQHTAGLLDTGFNVENIAEEVQVNFTSIVTLVHLMLPALQASDSPIILNVNSGLAITPKSSSAVYCATKAALSSFSTSLRYQLEHTNIEVKQVFLPLVDTTMTAGRGSGKLSADQAAAAILDGLSSHSANIDVGKVKLLRIIHRISPALAAKIMKGN